MEGVRKACAQSSDGDKKTRCCGWKEMVERLQENSFKQGRQTTPIRAGMSDSRVK